MPLTRRRGQFYLNHNDLRVGNAWSPVGAQGPETRGGGQGGWTDRFQAMASLWTAGGLPPNLFITCVHMIRRRVLPFPEPQFPPSNRETVQSSPSSKLGRSDYHENPASQHPRAADLSRGLGLCGFQGTLGLSLGPTPGLQSLPSPQGTACDEEGGF